jgi:hypothetical protein
MSCLFDSLAALLVERPELLASSAFVELRELSALRPNGPTGRSVRAAICALLARRAIEVHGIALDEWGAMEAGTTRDAYVRGMRDGGTWGGGVEIAAAATAPIVVHYGRGVQARWGRKSQQFQWALRSRWALRSQRFQRALRAVRAVRALRARWFG